MVHKDEIAEYLTRLGWPHERLDSATWGGLYRGEVVSFRYYVRWTKEWLCITAFPFSGALQEQDTSPLHRTLLRLNREMNLAKYALDEEGEVVLCTELPTENLDFSELRDGLMVIADYADRHYLEVLGSAHRPHSPERQK